MIECDIYIFTPTIRDSTRNFKSKDDYKNLLNFISQEIGIFIGKICKTCKYIECIGIETGTQYGI